MTPADTDPKTLVASAPRPREPTTTRSASNARARGDHLDRLADGAAPRHDGLARRQVGREVFELVREVASPAFDEHAGHGERHRTHHAEELDLGPGRPARSRNEVKRLLIFWRSIGRKQHLHHDQTYAAIRTRGRAE